MPIVFWLKAGAAAAVVLGGLWLVDEIGDRREAVVNARWEKRMADARTADRVQALARERKAKQVGQALGAASAKAQAESEIAAREVEKALAGRTRTVCYPKEIIKALNK